MDFIPIYLLNSSQKPCLDITRARALIVGIVIYTLEDQKVVKFRCLDQEKHVKLDCRPDLNMDCEYKI
jgi:hypothetical protein